MKWSNVFKLLYLIFKWLARVFLCLLPFVCLAAFAFDRIIVSEVRSACELPVVDERQRRAIDQAFIFSWFHVARVGEIFEREHPRLSGIFTWHQKLALINACMLPRQWARVDLEVQFTPVHGKNGEWLTGLEAASQHWFGHGIELATPAELQVLNDNRATAAGRRPARRK
ncbi:hypothetical protein [Prosthecobacter sp.]|uniref:hypothetical protein n=1 Tax=Prosthecobacter sp. TaxID=1965333 RepID=UPI0037847331